MTEFLTAEEHEQQRLSELEGQDEAEQGYQSEELEAAVAWATEESRSVQEIAERHRLLEDELRPHFMEAISSSLVYDDRFMRDLQAMTLRDQDPRNHVRADSQRHIREAPEGFHKVLRTVHKQRELGRNLIALTPELLPESLVRIWAPGRPLPELLLINMDHDVPKVSMVQRLPSAGGMEVDRSTSLAMTGAVRQVLGNPKTLREIAARQGVMSDRDFDQVDVGLAEVAWSPYLELGELLYDWEAARLDEVEDSGMQEAHAAQEAQQDRLGQQQEVLWDQSSRLGELQGAWQAEAGEAALEAQTRLSDLQERQQGAQRTVERLSALQQELDLELHEAEENQAADLPERLEAFREEVEALEAETLQLAEELAEEERLLLAHRRSTEQQPERRRIVDEAVEEEEEAEGPLRAKDRIAREEAEAARRR